MARILFWVLVYLGRPFGGIRPRRMTHWLAKVAFQNERPGPSDYCWYRDKYGSEFALHPHFFVDRHVIAFGAYDEVVNDYIDKHIEEGMVCFDIGSNIGIMSLNLARKVGAKGAVYCFEPVPHLFQKLEANVRRNNKLGTIRLSEIALSDQSGRRQMPIANEFYENQGMGSLVDSEHTKLVDSIEIETKKLDEFVEQQKIERLDFMKVDIQGAEPLMLAGATDTLKRFKPELLMEISPEDLAGLQWDGPRLLRYLGELGYSFFEIGPEGKILAPIDPATMPADYSSGAILGRAT